MRNIFGKLFIFAQLVLLLQQARAAALTLYSQGYGGTGSVSSIAILGAAGSDGDVFTYASFKATQSGTVDNIGWQGTANNLYPGFTDGFTVEVLSAQPATPDTLMGNTVLAKVVATGATGVANATPAANGMFDYNLDITPFPIVAGTTYYISVRSNGLAPWGWAAGPGSGAISFYRGLAMWLRAPGAPAFALNNVHNSYVAPPTVVTTTPSNLTIVPVPAPAPTSVAGAAGDVQGIITSVGQGYVTINNLIVTHDGDTVKTFNGGLTALAVGEVVNYSYTVDVDGVVLAKSMDLYPTEVTGDTAIINSSFVSPSGFVSSVYSNSIDLRLSNGRTIRWYQPYFLSLAITPGKLLTYTGYVNVADGTILPTSLTMRDVPVLFSSVLPAATTGTPFSSSTIVVGPFGVGPYLNISATGLPAGLAISGNGVISGTPTTPGTYSISLIAHGGFLASYQTVGTGTATLVVSDPPVVVPPTTPVTFLATLADAQAGVTYPAVNLCASGVAPIAVTANGVPAGMSVSAAGELSGTPATAGTYLISLTGSDSAGTTGAGSVSLLVGAPVPPPVPMTFVSALAAGQVGNTYAPASLLASGVAPFNVLAAGVPAGLAVSAQGQLSGTPVAAGTYTIVLAATDSAGTSGTGSVDITIDPAPLVSTSGSGIVTSVGRNFLVINGGLNAADHVYYTATPAGTTFLGGTSTFLTGEFVAFAGVLDGIGAVHATSMTVYPRVAFVSTIAPTKVGLVYPAVNLVSSGTAPFAVAGAGLPVGMVLSADGVLSGIADFAGTYTITLTATDSVGNSGTGVVTLLVEPAPLPPTPVTFNVTPIGARVGTPLVTASLVTSGVAPVVVTGNGLPPGLTLSAQGDLSGTPTVAGTYSLALAAVDSVGTTGSGTVIVTVDPAPVVVASGSGIVTSVGRDFLVVNGGLNPADHVFYTPTPAGTTFTGGTIGFIAGEFVAFTGTVDAVGAIHATAMTVYPSVTFVSSLARAVAGAAYTAISLVNSGTAPFTVVAAGLPVGMSVSADGILAGIPAAPGTYSLTVSATDGVGNSGAAAVTLVVDPAPVPPTPVTFVAALSGGQEGVPYPTINLVTSGVGSVAVSATGVPAGLTVSSSGILSGTPAKAGVYTLVLIGTDSTGTVGRQTLTLNIAPAVGVVSTGKSAEGSGRIVSLSENTVVVGTVTVRISSATVVKLQERKPLAVGARVEYKGIRNTDGSVTALSIQAQ